MQRSHWKKPVFQRSTNIPAPTHCQRNWPFTLLCQICKWSAFRLLHEAHTSTAPVALLHVAGFPSHPQTVIYPRAALSSHVAQLIETQARISQPWILSLAILLAYYVAYSKSRHFWVCLICYHISFVKCLEDSWVKSAMYSIIPWEWCMLIWKQILGLSLLKRFITRALPNLWSILVNVMVTGI